MNTAMLKKVLIIALIAGATFGVVNLVQKGREESKTTTPESTTTTGQTGGTKTPAGHPPAPTSAELALLPAIEALYKNKLINASYYSKFRIEILKPLDALVIVTPSALENPKIESSSQATMKQESWHDNLFTYVSIDKPTGSYTAELKTSFEFQPQYFCTVNQRTATCVISTSNQKINTP